MSPDNESGRLGVDRRSLLKGLGATALAAAFTGSTTAGGQGRGDPHGPYRKHRFIVEIDGLATAGFSRVELPDAAVADVEYREGTDPTTARKLAGNDQHEPLVLQKGVTEDSIELFEWFQQAQDGNLEDARRTVAVVLLDTRGEPGPRWEFRNAWPARYDGPDLDAQANETAIETLEVLHEGMERTA